MLVSAVYTAVDSVMICRPTHDHSQPWLVLLAQENFDEAFI